MLKLILLTVSYLLGSIPFGFLITYGVKGVDIRNFGSGNIGATNVVRVVSKPWGILVFLLDFLKGLAGPCLTVYLLGSSASLIIILSAIFVVCGHNWTIFLKFKGGKGVAASLGAITGLAFIFSQLWIALFVSLIIWVVVFHIFKYVSAASLTASAAFLIYTWISSLPLEIKFFSVLLFIIIAARHKKNIQSLLAKKENRFG
ncbi:MAG: glycerol-3-phosphate 1-O-acyltransferase PlsY [Candidatus Omnitrophota bacterium]